MEFMFKNKAGMKIPQKHSVWLSSSLFTGGEKKKKKLLPDQKPLKGHPDADENSSTWYMWPGDQLLSLEAVACALLLLFSLALFESP